MLVTSRYWISGRRYCHGGAHLDLGDPPYSGTSYRIECGRGNYAFAPKEPTHLTRLLDAYERVASGETLATAYTPQTPWWWLRHDDGRIELGHRYSAVVAPELLWRVLVRDLTRLADGTRWSALPLEDLRVLDAPQRPSLSQLLTAPRLAA